MLNIQLIKKIEDFIYAKPRSVQEIASHLDKNWRTADRYVQEIEKQYGTLATRTFREGTRGALKIVYWASVEKASNSVFQEQLEKKILSGIKPEDFLPFDIFQHVPDKNKDARVENGKDESLLGLDELKKLLNSARKQILIFSGNLSFFYFRDKETNILHEIEKLLQKNISIKVISRVDYIGSENIRNAMSLNLKHGKENIEIRHREQPLRAIIIDNKILSIKEKRKPTREGEAGKNTFIFYTIKSKDWVEWLTKIFWNMFSSSINANKRLEEMRKFHS
ncbi:MAG: hypothetical protein ABH864_02985 [archaeon]